MRILISGASGLIGQPVCEHLRNEGHKLVRLTRRPANPDDVFWDPVAGILNLNSEDCFHAVIHLAGENIAGGLWSAARKKRILESRVKGAELLCRRLSAMSTPPKVYLSASAVGFYPFDTFKTYDETGPPGDGFLATVCQQWEKAADPLINIGTRVVYLRFGVVLSARGGALGKMLPIFKLGLGGPVGSGQQMMSWIALPDVVGVISACLRDPAYAGPVNVVAPQPVSNREFSRVLGKVLKRPAFLPAPAFLLSLLLGQMARETLLADCRVAPAALNANGYTFQQPDLETALARTLRK